MKPVDQAIIDDGVGGRGDCMRACVASILELSLADVPHFFDYDEPDATTGLEALAAFLSPRGLAYSIITVPAPIPADIGRFVQAHYVLCGRIMGGETTHAVVGLRGEQVHDPSPLRRGVKPFEDDTFVLYLICRA